MDARGPRLAPLRWALVYAVFAAAALVLYRPALDGPFIGDDYGYVVNNAYIQELTPANLEELLAPYGAAATFTANYAPVHLLAHALEWRLFADDPTGYHVANVLLHALASTLLAALLLASRLPATAAGVLAAIFLVHPANVEAVAWIFQLKTILALSLSLGALLLLPRRPGAATALFALALLSKIAAAYALPVALLRARARGGPSRSELSWLGAWALLLGLVAAPQFAAFDRLGHAHELAPYASGLEQARSIVAIAARYAVMAYTSYGVSAFHEVGIAGPWSPWWLGGLLLLGLLGARSLWAFRERREEAAYWGLAAASFAPVSQVFPFLYPVADRYLYFILPGLLGGAWFAGADLLRALERRRGSAVAAHARRVLLGAGVVCIGLLALHSGLRTPIWRTEITVHLDAARSYPHGIGATFLRARRAAQQGDVESAAAALDALADRGYDGFMTLQRDPGLAPLHGSPRFDAAVARVARNWSRQVEARPDPIQPELRMLALAYLAQGERERARDTYARALEVGGPLDATIGEEVAALRARGRL